MPIATHATLLSQIEAGNGGRLGLAPEQLFLCCCLARFLVAPGEILGALPGIPKLRWERVLGAAFHHRVGPLLYFLHQEAALSPPPHPLAVKHLEQAALRALAQHLVLRVHLKRILEALDRNGTRAIVLKGLPLEDALYPRAGLRLAGDIDLLLQPDDLQPAATALLQLGFAQETAGAAEVTSQLHHHLPPFFHQGSGAAVELHWDVVAPRRPYRMELDGLWSRAQPWSLDGAPCLVLAPEDQLLHLCLHFLGDRMDYRPAALSQVCDIALLLKAGQGRIDPERLVRRAQAEKLDAALYTVLFVVRWITGVGLPPQVEAALAPTGFKESEARLFGVRRVLAADQYRYPRLVRAMGAPSPWRGLLDLIHNMAVHHFHRPEGATAQSTSVLGKLANLPFSLARLRDQVRLNRFLSSCFESNRRDNPRQLQGQREGIRDLNQQGIR